MCIAIPGKIIKVTQVDGDPIVARVGTVDMQGSRFETSLALTPEAIEGDWVLVHAGFALAVLDEAEARETWDLLRAVLDDSEHPAPASEE